MSEWRYEYTSTAEQERQHRHHEVLCLVLKALVARQDVRDAQIASGTVMQARLVADLAYPPPKAGGT